MQCLWDRWVLRASGTVVLCHRAGPGAPGCPHSCGGKGKALEVVLVPETERTVAQVLLFLTMALRLSLQLQQAGQPGTPWQRGAWAGWCSGSKGKDKGNPPQELSGSSEGKACFSAAVGVSLLHGAVWQGTSPVQHNVSPPQTAAWAQPAGPCTSARPHSPCTTGTLPCLAHRLHAPIASLQAAYLRVLLLPAHRLWHHLLQPLDEPSKHAAEQKKTVRG